MISFGLGGISVSHRSYWVLCRMKGCCTVQPYRRVIHFIFLLVMQFQSMQFSKDSAVSPLETVGLGFSPNLWHCCAFPEMVRIICH